jgi:thioredoxin-related protein
MKMTIISIIVLVFISVFPSYSQGLDENKGEGKFDPARNPFTDLKETILQTSQSGKRILLDVGGEWCIWCRTLDAFIKEHQEIKDFLNENFVELKINFSKENKNEKFLDQYPKVPGYPHIFILEKDGKLLFSKNTSELEKEKSYDADKILAFLKEWAPAKEKK